MNCEGSFGKPKEKKRRPVIRIKKEKHEKDMAEKGIPHGLENLIPGASWLVEHDGIISGEVDEKGDVIINKHEPL